MQLFDAHCHYSFAANIDQFARVAAERLMGAFSTTVSPQDYADSHAEIEHYPSIKVGLGAHPWWVSRGVIDGREVDRLVSLIPRARYIGEVGLDFGRNGLGESVFGTDEETQDEQLKVLRVVFAACAENPLPQGRVFSFHAVRSADIILDLLEEYGLLEGNTFIFHWFSGSNPQLRRAIDLGCHFSVNTFMLNTKRGREYAKQIPLDRLLVETDLPEGQTPSLDSPSESELTRHDETMKAPNAAQTEAQPETQTESQWQTYIATLEDAYLQLKELRGAEVFPAIEKTASRIFQC